VIILQQKLMDGGFLKTRLMKPTGYFGPLTDAALNAASGGDVKQVVPTKNSIGCQIIDSKSDVIDLQGIVNYWKGKYPKLETYSLINRMMSRFSQEYVKQGIPIRASCEISLIQIRPNYKDKFAIIIDTLNKLLYIFDNNGKFKGKTEVISGKDKQSIDPKVVARALLTTSEQIKSIGFEWQDGKGYVDMTGKNRKYNYELIYKDTDKTKTRFLPKGIYTTDDKIRSNTEYAGKTDNFISLFKDNKELGQAIHGYYVEQPRTEAIKKAQEVLSKPNDPNVSKEFMDLVSKNKVNLSQSYGCINIPSNFLSYLRKYGKNSYVFNIGEDKQNYLVNNTENFINKMQNSQGCPSPQSLGAISSNDVA